MALGAVQLGGLGGEPVLERGARSSFGETEVVDASSSLLGAVGFAAGDV